jgi:Raf kinase inhibitor-like YbhB/YbcL family protein
VPKEAKELVLFVDDPDAPGGSFIHWTVYGISPSAKSIPPGALQGENSAGKPGYTGPCPPEGDDPHRYVFALYALEKQSGLARGASPDEVRSVLDRSALARGQLIAKY